MVKTGGGELEYHVKWSNRGTERQTPHDPKFSVDFAKLIHKITVSNGDGQGWEG